MNANLRVKAASAALLVLFVAVAVHVADSLLASALPTLVTLGALSAIYLFFIRTRR